MKATGIAGEINLIWEMSIIEIIQFWDFVTKLQSQSECTQNVCNVLVFLTSLLVIISFTLLFNHTDFAYYVYILAIIRPSKEV